MTTPEQQDIPVQKTPDSVIINEIPDTPEETPEVKEAGITSFPSQFQQVIRDDTTQQSSDTPADPKVTVTIPATQAQLDEWAKGPDESALTWLAKFWLRMIKKAMLFGWNVVTAPFGSSQNPAEEK